MVVVIEQKASTILRRTGINLAPYVINPYQGCQMGCLFCYAQFSKVARREKMSWGNYVKVKINALEILEKELKNIKPEKVLLGSTTECFQPIEKKYKLTEKILEILNEKQIPYVILTRSLLIKDYFSYLKKELCRAVYFTVDCLPAKLRKHFEPKTPPIQKNIDMINLLCQNNINTVAYFCPIMPWIFDFQKTLEKIRGCDNAEFEIMNFTMAGMDRLIKYIYELYPEYAAYYAKLLRDKDFYQKTVAELEVSIENKAKKFFKTVKIYKHKFKGYFSNQY